MKMLLITLGGIAVIFGTLGALCGLAWLIGKPFTEPDTEPPIVAGLIILSLIGVLLASGWVIGNCIWD